MITTNDLGLLIDLLRPSLNRMVSVAIDEARRKGQIPSLMPGTVTANDSANGAASVLLDAGDGDVIVAATLVGMPAVNARVMILWEPPSQPFIVGYLGTVRRPRQAGGQWRRNATQVIPTGGFGTLISWDTETSDSDNFIAVPGNQFTVPPRLGGSYLVTATVIFNVGVGGSRSFVQISGPGGSGAQVYRNSIAGSGAGGDENVGSAAGWLELAEGDQFGVLAYQSTGVDQNCTAQVRFWRVAD